mmetsp:Transcript_62114/g.115225  ORF Transcript_62114/g.115225 Transcript_62114/m.115225 type:complete len:193 (+) Transcript_62114:109-687(+)
MATTEDLPPGTPWLRPLPSPPSPFMQLLASPTVQAPWQMLPPTRFRHLGLPEVTPSWSKLGNDVDMASLTPSASSPSYKRARTSLGSYAAVPQSSQLTFVGTGSQTLEGHAHEQRRRQSSDFAMDFSASSATVVQPSLGTSTSFGHAMIPQQQGDAGAFQAPGLSRTVTYAGQTAGSKESVELVRAHSAPMS